MEDYRSSELLGIVYPVGSIFTTTVATNPNLVFGFGTWEAFGSGRCLVGVDTNQTEFDTVEETGGAKTHTLTVSEIPAHDHLVGTYMDDDNANNGFIGVVDGDNIYSDNYRTGSAGGGDAHNNLQPYITVYFWKRVG